MKLKPTLVIRGLTPAERCEILLWVVILILAYVAWRVSW